MKDKAVQYLFVILIIKLLILSVSLGVITGLVLTASFLIGFFSFQSLFKSRNELNNLLSVFTNANIKNSLSSSSQSAPCNVCNDGKCDRERVIHHQKPWTGLTVPKEVDQAVTDLLQKTLDEFITSWMKEITTDESFQQEIKEVVRHAASVILSRGLKVDIARLVTTKGLREVVKHTVKMKQAATSSLLNVHPAVTSREAELSYLRNLTSHLLPLLVTSNHLNCKTFEVLVREIVAGWLLFPLSDIVCDPMILNSLLLLLMGRQPLTDYPPSSQNNQVEFLAEFVSKQPSSNSSALQPDMCIILKDQSLLFAFMQFLKSQGSVYILQFCLDVEEFNRRMLQPELSSEDLDLLYRDAWDLYSVYFSPHSPDTLNFPDQIVTQMRKVLSKDVTKLRTSPPLFQAYEHAYSLLDSVYCPQFHSSDDFYSWLCGPKLTCSSSKSGSSSPSLPGSPAKSRLGRKGTDSLGAVSRLSSRLNKIKGALKAGPVAEGQTYSLDGASLELETDTEFAEALQYEAERDLSAWRVSIPKIFSRVDPTTAKVITMFTINIQRIDVTEGDSSQWTVERRLTDFYSLDAKLTEFHGDFSDAQLPPRRFIANLPSPSGRPESIQAYEEYLQKLLSKPALRGSDLLFSFLACPGDFVAEDSAFGRLLRRGVPLTLRKERGQHLEPFIATFVSSTESRIRHSKLEYKDLSEEVTPRNIRNVVSPVFGNNFGIGLPGSYQDSLKKASSIPDTPTQSLIYFGVNILQWSQTTTRFVIAVQKVFGNTIDALLQYWLDRKLKHLLVPQRIAHLIKLLQWALFESKSKMDRSQVARAVELQLSGRKGWTLPVYQGLYLALQSPVLNKQLFYCLLDELMLEMFPELGDNETKKDSKFIS